MTTDRWGREISGSDESVDGWNRAWTRLLHFTDDPVELLEEANERDDSFVMGSVFAGTYAVLSGSAPDAPSLRDAVERATRRATSELEREHASALQELAVGNFTDAGDRWGRLGAHADDFVAYRFAHDVFLHVGDADRRLAWSNEALAHRRSTVGSNFIDGMHAFALNEVGDFAQAERFGRQALDADPLDLWARHALAHVFEDTDDTERSMELLRESVDVWSGQDQLAIHIWWHLALRLLRSGAVAEVLSIYDERVDDATTAFRLCDLTSLLWRVELDGHDVGDRWEDLVDRWSAIEPVHTNGFLDLHAALAFSRLPDHSGAANFHAGLAERPTGDAEIDRIFDDVARPLIGAIAAGNAAAIEDLVPHASCLGGSNAQRSIISLTAEALR